MLLFLAVLVAATVGMGVLTLAWWGALFSERLGFEPWAATLYFNRFHEQWVEGVFFNALVLAVLLGWWRVWWKVKNE